MSFVRFLLFLVSAGPWHGWLVGYFTQETANTLYSVRDFAHLAHLEVPRGSFRSARSAKGRPRTIEHMLHTVDPGRHTPSPRHGSPSSSPYTYTHRRSPIPIRPSSGSPSSHNGSRYRDAVADQNSGLHLDPLNVVVPPPAQPLSYEPPCGETDLDWLCVPPTSNANTSGVGLAPLAFLENSHIPRRHPVDDRVLRAFSFAP